MSTKKKKPDDGQDKKQKPGNGEDSKRKDDKKTLRLTQAERELVDAQDKAEQNRELYLRAAAELENLRKRSLREIENARRYGIERFAQELLGVKDSLEMGLEAASEASTVEALMEGKQATLKQLEQLLERFSISELNPIGEAFDPDLHEAMATQPSEEFQPGQVMIVIQKGYRIHDRLLRPARVIIAKEVENQEATKS